MATRDEWASTGKELGSAFKGLAKSVIRSAKVGVEKAEEWADSPDTGQGRSAQDAAGADSAQGSNVFNDGSWRKTGKDLGSAFMSFGNVLMNTIEEGAGKAEEWTESSKSQFEEKAEDAAQKAEDWAYRQEKRFDEKVKSAADAAEHAAESLRRDACEFGEGLKEGCSPDNVVAEAEVISEEILSDDSITEEKTDADASSGAVGD